MIALPGCGEVQRQLARVDPAISATKAAINCSTMDASGKIETGRPRPAAQIMLDEVSIAYGYYSRKGVQ